MRVEDTFSDITCAQPLTREVWKAHDVHRWASVAGIYLSVAAMIVLAITHHRMLEATRTHQAEFEQRQREFNHGLVAAIKDLAEKTGILTSADFCPVRFRIRLSGGNVPANRLEARLIRVSSDHDDLVYERSSSVSGMIDFGLLAPGTFQLQVWSPDGMWLVHEFDVLPGVPVDRVVICPMVMAPVPGGLPVNVNWPAELASEDVVALIEILPGPFESGDWRWQPNMDVPPLYAVATTGGDAERLLEKLDTPQIDSLLQANGLPVAEIVVKPQLTYRYCQIGSITFLHLVRGSTSRRQLQMLGTLHYESAVPSASFEGPRWEADCPPPHFEIATERTNHWNVDLPPECVDKLLKRIRESSSSHL